MRHLASTLTVTLFLVGCAMKGPYGNFVENQQGIDQQKIANDTVRQLSVLYPPAKTRFELQHSALDPFGQAFVRDLRERGYALLEFDPRLEAGSWGEPVEAMQVPNTTSSFPLSYLFDQAIDTDLYHVTVIVGDQSITRAYAAKDGTSAPAGYWVRKE